MLRLVTIFEQTAAHVIFRTKEFYDEDLIPYVVYDTSTGIANSDDYPVWRSLTALTSTGSTTYEFQIDNTNLYNNSNNVTDYSTLNPKLFKVMTLQEYDVLQDVLIRLDLVRRRLPNPGITIQSIDNVGENGAVSYAGGYEKKMTVDEIGRKIEGTFLEVNGTPPRTVYWPRFITAEADEINNPYLRSSGFPDDLLELVKMGALMRCLMAVGILEIDVSFTTSDSGLQLTWDRANQLKGWRSDLVTEYKDKLQLFKMNHYCGPTGVGTYDSAASWWGTMLNSASSGGALSLNTLLGLTGGRGNVRY